MSHTNVIDRAWRAIFAITSLSLVVAPIVAHANFSIAATAANAIAPPSLRSQSHRNIWARSAYPVAVGYGKAIPLAFALRQIVPHGVLVVLAPEVDASTIVSWQGGLPWDIALRRALAAAHLRAVITPVEVKIRGR